MLSCPIWSIIGPSWGVNSQEELQFGKEAFMGLGLAKGMPNTFEMTKSAQQCKILQNEDTWLLII
jgi:hypothetical protein